MNFANSPMTPLKKPLLILASLTLVNLFLGAPAFANQFACEDAFSKTPASDWLPGEVPLSITHILRNISPADAKPGAIIAAQTRVAPNYYYVWVRDAGLTIEAIQDAYVRETDSQIRRQMFQRINDYFGFNVDLQNVSAQEGLGEPKYNVNGTAFTESWGRPQNDGPAIRASSLIRWYHILSRENQMTPELRRKFYSLDYPATSVIKKDLEYVSHHWRDPSFDLWEEVRADHFYTRMVQRRALIEGADLAHSLGDIAASDWYSRQAHQIEIDLEQFWDPARGYFVASRNRVGGLDYKHSELDVAVVLGFLHGTLNDGFMSFDDSRLLRTMEHLERAFHEIYPVNQQGPGEAIGRYPEDLYGGANFDGGNPWPLATLGMAEAYYKIATAKAQRGELSSARALIAKGDAYVARVHYHAPADGSLNEQISRGNGFMTSVSDLTWNYSAILTASYAREAAVASLP